MGIVSYQAGAAPSITIGKVEGNLLLQGWDQQTIEIDYEDDDDERSAQVQPGETGLVLPHLEGSVTLRLPRQALVTVAQVEGQVRGERLGSLTLSGAAGDVVLHDIAGDVELGSVEGELVVAGAARVVVREAGGAKISGASLLESEHVSGDLEARGVATVPVARVAGDCEREGGAERG